ncbi:MAG: bifunctional alpha,alpha-trehalose-phosphate synthase (UDP-forming)/trehalose-phosphatase [Flavobacteriaceae bacterium]|nr:bifunctional alpha,alpha-trehalose-phosphate synthase (UDP-forming)/trehalose-phosphatase [Flavobacteriaceae bacterium]
MGKNIIVSNRLPIRVSKLNNSFEFTTTTGGLATGMKSFHSENNSLWIGWPGIGIDEIDNNVWDTLNTSLKEGGFYPVNLNNSEINDFYFGLPNKCLWPLFHYFIEYSVFSKAHWETYVAINQKFAAAVLENISAGDTVWIHDYQLLLCPKIIKDLRPDVTVGFFLHIPFPSFEIFRTFPEREALLEGVLGADLIGFHTYDYQRHFLSSVKRILRLEVNFNKITLGIREIVVNTFPMGIDYEKFNVAAKVQLTKKNSRKSELKKQIERHKKASKNSKLILSIDRLDYTKGVINRIKAFEMFLKSHPQYLEKVRLIMLTVPSRSNVPEYKQLKRDTDEIVGRVNGEFATVNWTPIWYYYRSMSFEDLIDLYSNADIAMITPIRDGMNLVAKEYVATRINNDGVLILSEMAGASKELFQALVVNPFDINSMSEAIYKALNMPLEEQQQRNISMRKRLSRYTVQRWADDFMSALNTEPQNMDNNPILHIDPSVSNEILKAYKTAKNRLLLLDYDGTLVEFNEKPNLAIPSPQLLKTIEKLIQQPNTDVVIISGRDQLFLDKWFGKMKLTLVAEHGYFIKNEKWTEKLNNNKEWIQNLLPIFNSFTDRTPGTFVEEKQNSLVWHYRKTDPELANNRAVELKTVIKSLAPESISLMDMDKAIEITNSQFNKGTAVSDIISKKNYDFTLCIGDDVTDENMFINLNEEAYTLKVGKKTTAAKYYIKNPVEVKKLLKLLAD